MIYSLGLSKNGVYPQVTGGPLLGSLLLIMAMKSWMVLVGSMATRTNPLPINP